MSLIEIKAEPELLKKLLSVLNRIADALDRAYPEQQIIQSKPYGPEALMTFDPEKEWTVNTGEFRSKSRNSALNGVRLTGRSLATLVGGRLIDPALRESDRRGA